MKLTVINSGSVGNCYLFEAKDSTLIVECGVPFKEIKKALDFNLNKVAGAIVTHEHKDHSKSVTDTLAAGINVWASNGTHKAIGSTDHHRSRIINNTETFHVGDFKILPFDVKHDCAKPLGFLIHHPECGNTLFITDSYYVGYTFNNLNNIIVEANYCWDIIREKMEAGNLNGFVRDRVVQSHMNIDTTLALLAANNLKAVNNIVLIHLSDSNSDAIKFKQRVTNATGKTVHVAKKGLQIELNKTAI
jgi:phosphoribosyl 1,2-cyclic phosphodiesterase